MSLNLLTHLECKILHLWVSTVLEKEPTEKQTFDQFIIDSCQAINKIQPNTINLNLSNQKQLLEQMIDFGTRYGIEEFELFNSTTMDYKSLEKLMNSIAYIAEGFGFVPRISFIRLNKFNQTNQSFDNGEMKSALGMINKNNFQTITPRKLKGKGFVSNISKEIFKQIITFYGRGYVKFYIKYLGTGNTIVPAILELNLNEFILHLDKGLSYKYEYSKYHKSKIRFSQNDPKLFQLVTIFSQDEKKGNQNKNEKEKEKEKGNTKEIEKEKEEKKTKQMSRYLETNSEKHRYLISKTFQMYKQFCPAFFNENNIEKSFYKDKTILHKGKGRLLALLNRSYHIGLSKFKCILFDTEANKKFPIVVEFNKESLIIRLNNKTENDLLYQFKWDDYTFETFVQDQNEKNHNKELNLRIKEKDNLKKETILKLLCQNNLKYDCIDYSIDFYTGKKLDDVYDLNKKENHIKEKKAILESPLYRDENERLKEKEKEKERERERGKGGDKNKENKENNEKKELQVIKKKKKLIKSNQTIYFGDFNELGESTIFNNQLTTPFSYFTSNLSPLIIQPPEKTDKKKILNSKVYKIVKSGYHSFNTILINDHNFNYFLRHSEEEGELEWEGERERREYAKKNDYQMENISVKKSNSIIPTNNATLFSATSTHETLTNDQFSSNESLNMYLENNNSESIFLDYNKNKKSHIINKDDKKVTQRLQRNHYSHSQPFIPSTAKSTKPSQSPPPPQLQRRRRHQNIIIEFSKTGLLISTTIKTKKTIPQEKQILYSNVYSKRQKFFLHPTNLKRFIFFDNEKKMKMIFDCKTNFERDLIINCYYYFRKIYYKPNDLKILGNKLTVISPDNIIINKEQINKCESLFKYQKINENDSNNGKKKARHPIYIYNAIEEFVGIGTIDLYQGYFKIKYNNVVRKRYYSAYSQILNFNKQNQLYYRFQIDEYEYINIISKKQFHNDFQKRKSKYLNYQSNNKETFYKVKIILKDNGILNGFIFLFEEYFAVQTNSHSLRCDYLPTTKPQRTVDAILDLLWIDLGNGFGNLKLIFQNATVAEQFRLSFLKYHSNWVGLSNRNLLKTFKILTILRKNNNLIHYNNKNSSSGNKHQHNTLKVFCKFLLSKQRIILLFIHPINYNLMKIKYFSTNKLKINNYNRIKNQIQINYPNNGNNIIEFKSKKDKHKFFNFYKLISNKKIINYSFDNNLLKKKYGSELNNYSIYFVHQSKIKTLNLVGILRLYSDGIALIGEKIQKDGIHSAIRDVNLKVCMVNENILELFFVNLNKAFSFGFNNSREREQFVWKFYEIKSKYLNPTKISYLTEFPIILIKYVEDNTDDSDENGSESDNENEEYNKTKKSMIKKKIPSILKITKSNLQIISLENSKISYSKLRVTLNNDNSNNHTDSDNGNKNENDQGNKNKNQNKNKNIGIIYQEKKLLFKIKFIDEFISKECIKMLSYLIELEQYKNHIKYQNKKSKQSQQKNKNHLIINNKFNKGVNKNNEDKTNYKLPIKENKNNFEITFYQPKNDQNYVSWIKINKQTEELILFNYPQKNQNYIISNFYLMTFARNKKNPLILCLRFNQEILFTIFKTTERTEQFLNMIKNVQGQIYQRFTAIVENRQIAIANYKKFGKLLIEKDDNNHHKNLNINNNAIPNKDEEPITFLAEFSKNAGKDKMHSKIYIDKKFLKLRIKFTRLIPDLIINNFENINIKVNTEFKKIILIQQIKKNRVFYLSFETEKDAQEFVILMKKIKKKYQLLQFKKNSHTIKIWDSKEITGKGLLYLNQNIIEIKLMQGATKKFQWNQFTAFEEIRSKDNYIKFKFEQNREIEIEFESIQSFEQFKDKFNKFKNKYLQD
ncbi:heat shock protein [Anaeramoeba flamelloides]|uniref:Heat shock protein n=1 Tax=Anaeramoeba flamelloides TaxID=1746091 RepID=A0ABQ8XVC3_9EUKA|nr:heat shock protein [Anaeramoeba flamelloides]